MLAKKIKDYINNTLLVVSSREAEFNYIKGIVSTGYECIMIDGIEAFMDTLETCSPGQPITIFITPSIPEDVELEIDLLVQSLEGLEGLNVLECTEKDTYFNNSMRIEDLYEIDASEEEIELMNKEEEMKKYSLVNDKKEEVEEVADEVTEEVTEEVIEEEVKSEKVPLSLEKKYDSHNIDEGEYLFQLERLNNIIGKLDSELKSNMSELEKSIKISNKLESEKELLLEDLKAREREINNLKLQGNKENEVAVDLIEELKSREALILSLENDIRNLKTKGVELEIDSTSKKELIKDKNKEIKKLKIDIEELTNMIDSLTVNINSMENSHVSVDKLEELGKVLKDKDIEIASLNDQIRVLKIDIRKTLDEHGFLQEEFEALQKSYREVVASNGKPTELSYNEIFLSDNVRTSIFYFKVINQPPYFKSLIQSLNRLITPNGKTLIIIIRELDDISKHFYSGINEYNNLDEVDVKLGETVILLKPSKLMLTENEEFYSNYKNIILLDYSRSLKVLIKGLNVFTIYTYMNEAEKDILGLEGMTLTVGKNSIVDLKYDVGFENDRTGFTKKLFVDKKVKNWLTNLGIRMK